MEKGPKTKCSSTSHKLMKDKAKNRVEDLQEMLADLQSARRESRTSDAVVLEEQVHQMLREWKAELNAPSPASSLHVVLLTPHLRCPIIVTLLFWFNFFLLVS